MSQIVALIPFKYSHEDRYNSLNMIISHIKSMGISVVVIEQDTKSNLDKLDTHVLFCKYSGPFNRSWAFNCGVKKYSAKFYLFIDGDILLHQNAIIKAKEFLINGMSMVDPYSILYNVPIQKLNSFNPDQYHNFPQRKSTFAGGAVLCSSDFVHKIQGWDESFMGWGGEDDAMTTLIKSSGPNNIQIKSPAIHIDHPMCGSSKQNNRAFYVKNVNRLNEIRSVGATKLVASYKRNRVWGDQLKPHPFELGLK